MMKLQKPVPKSLSKVGKTETSIKKKKSLVQNLKKNEATMDAVSGKSKKSKLIEEIIVKVAKDEKKKKNKKLIEAEQDVVQVQAEKKPKQKAPKLQKQQASANEIKETPPLKEQKKAKKNLKETAQVDAKNTTLKAANKKKKNAAKPTSTEDAAEKKAKQTKKEKSVAGPLTNLQKKKSAKLAFKKEQLKSKNKKSSTGEKKSKNKFEPVPFDEDKFKAIVNAKNIRQVVKALKAQVETQLKDAKSKKIFTDYRYFLNVAAFKIANCPRRMVKLNLKHSLVGKEDDVVLIVTDLQRGAKADYDPTIQHYEDLLREAGVEGVKVMPFNQLRNECNTYETVRKFSNTYDYFLCDGRIVSRVAGFCGKIFQKPRTTFHSVRMDNTKSLKNEIAKSMRRTAFKQIHKGDLISIPVGNHAFTDGQLSENILHVVSQLGKLYAGGLANIRKMDVKIDIVGTPALPIYMSMAQPPPETPSVIGPREQRLVKMKREANGVLTKFGLTKEGKMVKLSPEEIERKLKFKQTRALLSEEKPVDDDNDNDDDDDDDDDDDVTGKAPVDNDGDESVVPAKKARKEESSKVDDDVKKKDVEESKAVDEKDATDDKGSDEDAEANSEEEDDDDEEEDAGSEEDFDEDGEDDDDVVEGIEEDDDDDDDEDEDGEEAGGDDGDDDEEDCSEDSE